MKSFQKIFGVDKKMGVLIIMLLEAFFHSKSIRLNIFEDINHIFRQFGLGITVGVNEIRTSVG
jgi:hypothetical protein